MHEHFSAQIDHGDAQAFHHKDAHPFAGIGGTEIHRPHQPVRLIDEIEEIALRKRVIAHSQHIDAHLDQLMVDPTGDAFAMRRVFTVGNDKVDGMLGF